MAIAGKVAITPKGEWVNSITYDKLDLVTYNGSAFVSKKSSTGETPVDGDVWMLLVSDSSDAIADIVSGATTVGNSSKLNGLPAGSYLRDTTKYAGSSTPGGGATKVEYEVIFSGFADSNIEDLNLTSDDCDSYNSVGITASVGEYKISQRFPMSAFYGYRDTAVGCGLVVNQGTTNSVKGGLVRFNDVDSIIEVYNCTVLEIVFYGDVFDTVS